MAMSNPPGGLRQGDPLSLYLFIMIADTFSCLISKVVVESCSLGASQSKWPMISHLLFADDSLLFG